MKTKLLFTQLLAIAFSGNAHIYFETPEPRSCFYGGYWGFDNDGPWRREPCDRNAQDPIFEYNPGEEICLTLQEFVDHPGYYDIYLAYSAVNPGDDFADWIPLALNVPDQGDSTGFQAFIVTLPENKTCTHCTIQVKQWAADFEWFYYACTDISIVPGTSNSTVDPDECAWRPGPSRIRMQILQTILISSYFLVIFLVLASLLVLVWTLKSQNARMSDKLKSYAKSNKQPLILIGTLILISAVALSISIVGLKSCW